MRTTYGWLRESLRYVAGHRDEILSLLADCSLPPPRIAVTYQLESFEQAPATILTRHPYTLSGAPVEVSVPHLARFVGVNVVTRQLAYAVPSAVAEHLTRHGLEVNLPPPGVTLDAEIALVRRCVVESGRGILEAGSSSHLDVDISRARST